MNPPGPNSTAYAHASPAPSDLKALIVGTDPAEEQLLKQSFGRFGIEAIHVNGGYEAVRLLLRDRAYVALLLDARLPAMRTFALAALVRQTKLGCDAPLVLILDSEHHEPISFVGRESAPVDVLYRPIDAATVEGKIHLLSEFACQRRQLLGERAERARVEAALEESELRQQLTSQATRDALYEWDLRSNVIQWNQALGSEYGYPHAAMRNDYAWWYERIHPDDRERIINDVGEFIAGTEAHWSREYRFRRGDGAYAYVVDRGFLVRDKHGMPVRMIGAVQDLTARKRAEEALKRSEAHARLEQERLRRAAKAAHIGLWEVDVRTAKVWRSDEHDMLFGYREPLAEWNRDVFLAHVHPDDRELVVQTEYGALYEGKPFDCEFRVIAPDGGVRWMLTRGQAEFDEHGPARIFGTTRDVTDQRRVEEELREAVRARDEFLSIASHELKTPLTAIGLQAEIIKRTAARSDTEALTPDRAARLAQQIDRQVRRLTRIVDDMLDISRLATGRLAIYKERFDLAELASEVIERMTPQVANSGAHIALEVAGPVVGLWDRFRIEQVLMNLLTNAARYGGGKPITVRLHCTATHAVLQVRDEGPGIAKQDQERIFERFERASSTQAGGLGLGLFIARQIVTLHGGTIGVESEIGRGALFTVELPLA